MSNYYSLDFSKAIIGIDHCNQIVMAHMFTTRVCTNKINLPYKQSTCFMKYLSLDQLQIKNFNFAKWQNPLNVVGCRLSYCQLKIGASNETDPALQATSSSLDMLVWDSGLKLKYLLVFFSFWVFSLLPFSQILKGFGLSKLHDLIKT